MTHVDSAEARRCLGLNAVGPSDEQRRGILAGDCRSAISTLQAALTTATPLGDEEVTAALEIALDSVQHAAEQLGVRA